MSITVTSPSATRWGVRGAVLAASAWTLSAVLALAFPGPGTGPKGSLSWLLIESSGGVALAGILLALVGLHARQERRDGRLGRVGAAVAIAGTGSALATYAVYLPRLTDGIVLDVLEYGWLLGWFVGLPLLGVAIVRAGVLPRWCGSLVCGYPAVFALVYAVADQVGEARLLLGLPWLAVAYALRSGAPRSVRPAHRGSPEAGTGA